MYAIYYSDHSTEGTLRLFGVVKHEAVAIEIAKIFSFELRWNRYQLRYCRSAYVEGSIPQFTVYSLTRSGHPTYYGFFRSRSGAQRLMHYMFRSYPGIIFRFRNMSDNHELRASHLDSKSSLF